MNSPKAKVLELERELQTISGHFVIVKNAGYGEVAVTVKDGKVVYIKQTIGQQITTGEQIKS